MKYIVDYELWGKPHREISFLVKLREKEKLITCQPGFVKEHCECKFYVLLSKNMLIFFGKNSQTCVIICKEAKEEHKRNKRVFFTCILENNLLIPFRYG